jgi:hypothetical protein
MPRSAPVRRALAIFALCAAGCSRCGDRSKPEDVVPSKLVVSVEGIGPLRHDSQSDADTLKRLFPGYEVTAQTGEGGPGTAELAYDLVYQGKTVMSVYGDAASKTVLSASIKSPDVQAPHGLRVGAPFSQLLAQKPQCDLGGDEEPQAVCSLPGEEAIALYGNLGEIGPQWDGSETDLPAPELLAKIKIAEIVWTPDIAGYAP